MFARVAVSVHRFCDRADLIGLQDKAADSFGFESALEVFELGYR